MKKVKYFIVVFTIITFIASLIGGLLFDFGISGIIFIISATILMWFLFYYIYKTRIKNRYL